MQTTELIVLNYLAFFQFVIDNSSLEIEESINSE